MKGIKKAIFALPLLLLSQLTYGQEYLASRVGSMFINTHSASPILSAGLYYGYVLSDKLAFEAESNIGLIGGNYQDDKGKIGRFSIWTAAAYGSYRHALTSKVYAKAKAGLIFESVTHITPVERLILADYGLSGGLGIGVRIKRRTTIEAEFTVLEKNIYYSGLGFHYDF